MTYIRADFSKLSKPEKIINVVSTIMSAVVVVLAILGLCDVLPLKKVNDVIIPVLGVIVLTNGLIQVKRDKVQGAAGIFAAVFIFAICIAVWIE